MIQGVCLLHAQSVKARRNHPEATQVPISEEGVRERRIIIVCVGLLVRTHTRK